MNKKVLLCLLLVAFTALASADDEKEKDGQKSIESSEESKAEKVKSDDVAAEDTAKANAEEEKAIQETPKEEDRKGTDKLILGRYELQTSIRGKDFKKLMQAMEFKKRHIRFARRIKKWVLRITKKDDKYAIWVRADSFHFRTKFEVGKEFDGKLFDGRKYKGVITFEGKNKMIRDEKHLGFECHHVYEFSENGIEANYKVKDVSAKASFKRAKLSKVDLKKIFG